MGNTISSTGFLSSVTTDSLTPFQTTTSASQLITFKDAAGNQLEVNALTIYSGSSDALYVKINSGSSCLYVGTSDSMSVNGQVIKNITIMGGSGVQYRYYAQIR